MEKPFQDWVRLVASPQRSLLAQLPKFNNEAWMKDKMKLAGRPLSVEDQASEGLGFLLRIRSHFQLFEEPNFPREAGQSTE
jgi:hypothetical protein